MKFRRWVCKMVGHRSWIVHDPACPLDFTVGCTRCEDPSTFRTLVKVDEDPAHPGWVKVQGIERMTGWLEAQR